MRILHILPTYIPATRYGGPVYSVHGLAKSQAALGHDVHVFTTNVDGPGVSPVPLGTPVYLDGVAVTYFPTGLGRRLFRSPALGRALGSQTSSFDIVHLHSVFLWPTFVAARAATRNGVPYVISPRGMLVRQLVARKSPLAKSAWIRLVERRNIEQAAAIHVTSPLEAADLADFGFGLPGVIEIANGIDLPEAFNVGDVGEDIRTAASRGAYVLSLGRMNWKKNLPELVRAWRDIRNTRLIIAGNQEDEHGGELVALVRNEGLSDRIDVFARPVLGADKEFLYERSTAFVLPSLSENFGNTVLEAMVRGKPVIVTETTGAANIVKAAHCGVVCAPDARSLAGAALRILKDTDELVRMGNRARTTALAQYGWDGVARQMTTAYEAIRDKAGRA